MNIFSVRDSPLIEGANVQDVVLLELKSLIEADWFLSNFAVLYSLTLSFGCLYFITEVQVKWTTKLQSRNSNPAIKNPLDSF